MLLCLLFKLSLKLPRGQVGAYYYRGIVISYWILSALYSPCYPLFATGIDRGTIVYYCETESAASPARPCSSWMSAVPLQPMPAPVHVSESAPPSAIVSGRLQKRGRGLSCSFIKPWETRWFTLDKSTGEMIYAEERG
jgi:hypothetical protein